MLDEVVRLGDGVALEGRPRQVVQAFEAAPLQQFGEAAFERDFQARMRAKGGENAAGARVHQGHAHHRELAAERGVLDQHREALLLQFLDAGDDARVFGQHLGRHVGQRDFAFEDFALHRPLEDFRQALHLRFDQRVAGAHAVAEKQVVDQVGREIHRLAVRLAHVGQRADAAFAVAGVGVEQVRSAQLAVRVVDCQAVIVEQPLGQRILLARLEPALVRVMDEGCVGEFLTPELIVVEMVAAQALDVFAQRRGQRALLGRALAVGEAHRRMRVADVQRPDIGYQVAPRGDLDLDAQPGEQGRHVGDGLFQRQVLAGDEGLCAGVRVEGQQRLRVGVEILDFLDDELGAGLHHFLDRAAVDRAQDAEAVLLGNVRRQLDLDLESLLVAVFRIDDVVLRQADVLGRDVARVAVELDEVGRAQGRRGQEVIERPRRRAVAFIADRLIGDDGEVVELGFLTKLVEKIDLDFHAGIQKRRLQRGFYSGRPPLSGFPGRKIPFSAASRLVRPPVCADRLAASAPPFLRVDAPVPRNHPAGNSPVRQCRCHLRSCSSAADRPPPHRREGG